LKNIKIMVFCDVIPSRLVNMLQYFWETCCLLFLLPEDGGSKFSTNCWYLSTLPHSITTQQTIILIFTAKEPDISSLYLLGTTFYPGCGKCSWFRNEILIQITDWPFIILLLYQIPELTATVHI